MIFGPVSGSIQNVVTSGGRACDVRRQRHRVALDDSGCSARQSKLDFSFLSDHPLLLHRQIQSLNHRTGEPSDRARRISDLPSRRKLESRIVRVRSTYLTDRAVAGPIRIDQQYDGNQIRLDLTCVLRVDEIIGPDGWCEWIAARQSFYSGNGPAGNRLQGTPGILAPCASFAGRKIVNSHQVPYVRNAVVDNDRSTYAGAPKLYSRPPTLPVERSSVFVRTHVGCLVDRLGPAEIRVKRQMSKLPAGINNCRKLLVPDASQ